MHVADIGIEVVGADQAACDLLRAELRAELRDAAERLRGRAMAAALENDPQRAERCLFAAGVAERVAGAVVRA